MSTAADRFAPRSPRDLVRLVRGHPLAWVASAHGEDSRATLLPLLPVLDEHGNITVLTGHFARSNSHLELLRRQPRALLLFCGPQGYISPSWIDGRTWAPTWNYASAQFVVDLQFFETPDRIEAHLHELVAAMEAGRPRAWRVEEMGERYASLSRGVVGFDAIVREASGRFKLGQDERDAVFGNIVAALLASSAPSADAQLLQWMQDFNVPRATAARSTP